MKCDNPTCCQMFPVPQSLGWNPHGSKAPFTDTDRDIVSNYLKARTESQAPGSTPKCRAYLVDPRERTFTDENCLGLV